jgi:hypothetical protein
MGVRGQRHAPAALPPGKISPPPGFDPWIFQPVESHYTDYATPSHNSCLYTAFKGVRGGAVG